MEISTLFTPHKQSKYHQPHSSHDVCFHPDSNHLIRYSSEISLPENINSYEQSFRQLKTGLIDKKTLNTRWQSRFFVLTRHRLFYFADQQRNELKGCFNFLSLKEYKLKMIVFPPEICFSITYSHENSSVTKTILQLHLTEQKEFTSWVSILKEVIDNIQVNSYHLSLYPRLTIDSIMENNQKIGRSNINFWNTLTISKTELINYASHLDIIFLRSKSAISNIHRFFMRSYYDHVGLLLKDQNERPYLLQAIQDKGVTISKLDNLFESFHQNYEDIGFRKLLIKNKKPFSLQKLQQYVNNLIGKKYQLSITKLLIGNDSQDQTVGADQQIKRDRTFFCSQLVADIYLKFKVLIQGKSSNYWPKDFEEGFIRLNTGFYLSSLMKVQIPKCQDRDRSTLQQ